MYVHCETSKQEMLLDYSYTTAAVCYQEDYHTD